ncbi:MAG: PVC-type heme-binding CxxCH protein, partial [Planctomycetaceae bacterium]
DQYLRAVFDKVPQPPPHGTPGADKITVFEDTDGDGMYDRSKDVITGLNIATSVCTGHGGIWVLNAPYLLFYPDENRDDVPDSEPTVCLSGFGIEDTHSVCNSLRWGPDGWLYGANGSTTTGNVSSAVTKNVKFEGQCIWRYHPDSQVFEIYAEGGGNTFSSEIDAAGRVFSGTNHGATRGMYYPQGSYGEKNWGKHGPLTNPYAFGYFLHMRHEGDKDRFPQTFVVYEGGALPAKYNRTIIAANSLHNRVWASELSSDGSTYRTKDFPPIVATSDRWFRPVDVEVGPDGAVYIADWYDTRLTHVDPRDNWHKTSGRIYRLSARDRAAQSPLPPRAKSSVAFDLQQLSHEELIGLFSHTNKWMRQTAVRVLAEKLYHNASFDTMDQLFDLCSKADSLAPLEALWTLHQAHAGYEELLKQLLWHDNPDLRRWAVRLLGDARWVSLPTGIRLQGVATREEYPQVRSQLASSVRRMSAQWAIPVLLELAKHSEDASDPHLPLQLWWGFEAHAGATPAVGPQLGVPLPEYEPAKRTPRAELIARLAVPEIWEEPQMTETVLPRLMRRLALESITEGGAIATAASLPPSSNTQIPEQAEASSSQDTPAELTALDACAKLLEMAPNDDHRGRLLSGFLEAYEGREIKDLPPSLAKAIGEYQSRIGNSDLALALKLGQPDAVKKMLQVVTDNAADAAARLAYIDLLGHAGKPEVVTPLLSLLTSPSPAIKRAAMLALLNYDDPKIGQTICSRYHSSIPAEHDLRSTAQRVLASRAAWTKQLLAEIEQFRIKPASVPLDIVQQMRLHTDADIQKRLDKHWGRTRATPAEKQQQITRVRQLIAATKTAAAGSVDPVAGREIFRKQCAVCHTLFDEGGQTGPKLTGYERDNLDFLVPSVVDPSAAIREEFTQFQVVTKDGLVLNGLLDDQTPTTVTLRGANNQTTVLNRDDVEVLKAVETSLMPEGVLEKLTDQDVQNLFAYLTRRTPLTGTGDK